MRDDGRQTDDPDCTAAFVRAPQEFLLARTRALGSVARFRLGPDTFWSVASPHLVRQVFAGDPRLFRKDWLYDAPRSICGDNIGTDEWEGWQGHHALYAPYFVRSRLASHSTAVVDAIERRQPQWEEAACAGVPIDPFYEARRIAFDAVLQTLLGILPSPLSINLFDVINQIACAEGVTLGRILAQLQSFGRGPGLFATSAYGAALSRLDDAVFQLLEQRLAQSGPADDLLTAAAAQYPLGKGGYLRDMLVTIAVTGAFSTADAVGWACYLLAKHEPEAAWLAEELDRAPGPRLGAVIDEALRLYPPVWYVGRVAAEPIRLDTAEVPPGDAILCSPYVLHRLSEYWEKPGCFAPQRFIEAPASRRAAFLPFGLGPRACIGQAMARTTMTNILSVLVARYHLRWDEHDPPEPGGAYTLTPRRGFSIRLQIRTADARGR